MAGAGYKLFSTGDVLSASDVNTYLQQQTVMVFASAAARTTALSGVVAEGMITYLKDTDALEIYSGTAWVGYGSGDITGVTAGTGISGGGTSGTVTISNSMATEITAAGDIIVGTGSGTFDNLPIGTTGQILTADTTVSPYKVKWATPSGGGKVLQVVYASYDTDTSSTSASFADTGLSATITPTLSTSKVLVLVEQNGLRKEGNTWHDIKLLRGATDILQFAELASSTATTTRNNIGGVGASYLDSPATTSATTYKTQFASGNGATVYVQNGLSASTITLLEIGA